MDGYELVYNVWYYRKIYDEWFMMRQPFKTLEFAMEVFREMAAHPEVDEAMLTRTETAKFSWLRDRKESSFTQYSAIMDV